MMTVAESRTKREWRRRLEQNPLAVALILSLVIHLGVFGTWQVGKKLGWWNHQASWLVKLTQKITATKPRRADLQPKQQAQQQPREIPLTFLEVDPATTVDHAPEKAKFYSDKNALASNTEPDTKPVPKIDGKQNQVARVMDNPKPVPFPLQPAPPKPEVKPAATDTGPKPGDLDLTRPSDGQKVTAKPDRPRTLAAAREKAMLAGEKLKQDGGAQRRGKVAFDTKATPFGAYDRAFIDAVENRWHYLIDNNLISPRAGRVVCEFKLTYDGRITEMKIPDNEVGEILAMLCRNAIEDNQRYPEWPPDMRRVIGSNARDIRFTFYYN